MNDWISLAWQKSFGTALFSHRWVHFVQCIPLLKKPLNHWHNIEHSRVHIAKNLVFSYILYCLEVVFDPIDAWKSINIHGKFRYYRILHLRTIMHSLCSESSIHQYLLNLEQFLRICWITLFWSPLMISLIRVYFVITEAGVLTSSVILLAIPCFTNNRL